MRAVVLMFIIMWATTAHAASCHLHKVWRYPWPQTCAAVLRHSKPVPKADKPSVQARESCPPTPSEPVSVPDLPLPSDRDMAIQVLKARLK